MKTLARLGALLTTVWLSTSLHAQLLSVEQLAGASQLTRNGLSVPLNPADPVVDQDRVQVGTGGRATLKLGAHGFIDLGPDADLVVERLPYASFASDLRTVLHLQKGYLRVVWNRPSSSARWPLFVRLGAHSLQLTSGEFFFDASGNSLTACAASGQMVVTGSRTSSVPLLDGRCHRLGSTPAQSTAYRAEDWVAVRTAFALRAPESVEAMTPAIAPRQTDDTRHPRVQIETVPSQTPAVSSAFDRTSSPTGAWVLNVASLSRESDAEQRAQQLREAGYPASVHAAEVNGRTWYRVRLSGYASRAEANAAADTVGEKLGILDAWASRD